MAKLDIKLRERLERIERLARGILGAKDTLILLGIVRESPMHRGTAIVGIKNDHRDYLEGAKALLAQLVVESAGAEDMDEDRAKILQAIEILKGIGPQCH